MVASRCAARWLGGNQEGGRWHEPLTAGEGRGREGAAGQP
jgi:hypothetical protein